MRPPPLPGPVRQIGYVVEDFDAAVQDWLAAGIGPWFVIRGVELECEYRGKPCNVTMTVGLANSGELQVELIQQENDTASIYTEFLTSGGPGFHQLAWWADDFDKTMSEVLAAGWRVVWSGGGDTGVRFAYVEPAGGLATILEIAEFGEGIAGYMQLIRDAAAGWDGSDPIRELG